MPDPNRLLTQLRSLYEKRFGETLTASDNQTFFDALETLDAHLSRGCELPEPWEQKDLVRIRREDLRKLLEDNKLLSAQVTATQESNTKLVEQRRELKALMRDLVEHRPYPLCRWCFVSVSVPFAEQVHLDDCRVKLLMEMT